MSLSYVSTRGAATPTGFVEAALTGLAPDGGLFVPEAWPRVGLGADPETYTGIAQRVLSAFAGGTVDASALEGIVEAAYAAFAHHSVAPLVQTGPREFLMELHHGPTLAFKDVAMQLIARLYDHLLGLRGETLTVICATSGDTGGAAAHAFAGRRNITLVILHPHERVSRVQRLFMTTTGAENVHNIAIDADFDAAQTIVKSLFADRAFSEKVGLSGVNSINWVRIAAQSVYFAAAQRALGRDTPIRFVVPTGNFGDTLAGYVAARCGLLTGGFEALAAVNANDTLTHVFQSGRLVRPKAKATPSPAMDIAVPSNLERLLFEVSGRDGDLIRALYQSLQQSGETTLPPQVAGPLSCTGISSETVSDEATLDEIARTHAETGWLICPHTAVGRAAARRSGPPRERVDVVLATAHAAKFPDTVERAVGLRPDLPTRCAAVADRPEAFEVMAADLDAVRDRILTLAGH